MKKFEDLGVNDFRDKTESEGKYGYLLRKEKMEFKTVILKNFKTILIGFDIRI